MRRVVQAIIASATAVTALMTMVPASAAPVAPPTVAPSSGPVSGGTLVTFTGAYVGFCDVIRFDGNLATTVEVASDNSWITVSTPAGNIGTVDITMAMSPRSLHVRTVGCITRTLTAAFTYVPDPVGPPSWLQSIGRASADAACPTGWNPSWAQWPNDNTGGFVCVREQYWAGSDWAYRAGLGTLR